MPANRWTIRRALNRSTPFLAFLVVNSVLDGGPFFIIIPGDDLNVRNLGIRAAKIFGNLVCSLEQDLAALFCDDAVPAPGCVVVVKTFIQRSDRKLRRMA